MFLHTHNNLTIIIVCTHYQLFNKFLWEEIHRLYTIHAVYTHVRYRHACYTTYELCIHVMYVCTCVAKAYIQSVYDQSGGLTVRHLFCARRLATVDPMKIIRPGRVRQQRPTEMELIAAAA